MIYAYANVRSDDLSTHNYINAGDGNDRVYGSYGSDTIIGGIGNDTLYSYGGLDVFLFTGNDGKDVIADFAIGQDTVHLDVEGFDLMFSDLTFSANGYSTIVSYLGNEITLQDLQIRDIQANMFVFG